jgi:hypothetical protein
VFSVTRRTAKTLDSKRQEAEYVTGLLETAGLSVALADMFRTLQCNTGMQKSLAFKPTRVS